VKRIQLLVFVFAVLMLVISGSNALADKPGSLTCSGGTSGNPTQIPAGTYNGLTVTGICRIVGNVTVNGNLAVAAGAMLNDHAVSFGTVHVTGNVTVGNGAVLGLGKYGAPFVQSGSVVDGSVVADAPLTLYLGGLTVHGNVVSNGGGSGAAGPFRNFPTKDDVIGGNLIVQGWQGGWIGIIRDNVGGNVVFSNNASVLHQTPVPCGDPGGPVCTGSAPGADPDSTEVDTNTIGGNLICQNNAPAAQRGDAPASQANSVAGNKIGECAAAGL
jgi:hypothetical protein